VKGYVLLFLAAKGAPSVVRWGGFVVFGLAAAPDFLGIETFGAYRRGWYIALILAWVAVEKVREAIQGSELDSYRNVFRWTADIISSVAGSRLRGQPQLQGDPDAAIESLLRRAVQLACSSVKPPHGCEFSAHVLRPYSDLKTGELVGLRAEYHDDWRPGRAHDIIPLDSPGAPETFVRGQPASIPDTARTNHPRTQDKPYLSVGTFPIWVGEPGGDGKVVAVLSLDSTSENIFNPSAVRDLHPFVAPIAQMIGLALTFKEVDGRP
jgi:hypothetical protein